MMGGSQPGHRQYTFVISRGRADDAPGDESRFTEYVIDLSEEATVLDALEHIRLKEEPGLLYRHSCHHASCGTCACVINGLERLACVTKIGDLDSDQVKVEPLSGFPLEADLVVSMVPFSTEIPAEWKSVRTSEGMKKKAPPTGVVELSRLEDCIECGICVSVCPVTRQGNSFAGPAALSALNRQLAAIAGREAEEKSLLAKASEPRGVPSCQRAIDCSRRCPSKVAPARHIAELRRRIEI